jgi:multidrug transporter EmrE-like cation transporter
MSFRAIACFVVAIALAMVGDILLKRGSEQDAIWYPLSAAALYSLTALPWLYVYREERFSVVGGILYPAISVILHVTVGALLFKEKLEPIQWLGVFLALTSTYLATK